MVVSLAHTRPYVAYGLTDSATVPDLVFSEMKFLRNHHGKNEHLEQTPDTKKRRKKEQARTTEEDISAFFTTVRPVLADTDGNIQTKSRHLTGSSAGAKAESPRRTQDPFKATVTAIPAAKSECKASYPGFDSKEQRSEGTSYFSWSESIRGPSITPERPRNTSTDNKKRIDCQNQETDEAAWGRGAAGDQQVSSSIIRNRVSAASSGLRLSSVTPIPAGFSRSRGLPEFSSSPRRPNLVDRAVNRHTNEDATSLSSLPLISQGHSNVGRREVRTTEDSIEMSYDEDNTESMQNQPSRNDARGCSARDCPSQLPRLDEMMQNYNETSKARPRQAPSGRGYRRRPETQPSSRSRDSIRQGRHDLYQTRTQAPTVRFGDLETHPSVPTNFSGPSVYVQQEQRQHLPIHLGFAGHGRHYCPDGIGQPCMSESGVLDYEDFEDFSDEQICRGLVVDADDDIEGLDYVADGLEQARELQHTSAVMPGFWRPNRLY